MSHSILIIDQDDNFYRERLRAAFPEMNVLTARSSAEAIPYAGEAEVLGAMPRVFNEELVSAAKHLKWIQVFTTGMDHVLGLKSLKKDTLLTSMRGIHGPQMAEMALMLMMALARDLPRMVRNQQAERWERFLQRRLYGKTVVILGTGIIGVELAARCKALGMTVVGVSSTPREIPGFDRIMPRSRLLEAVGGGDFVVVLVPYDKSTDKMVNARVLGAMKPSAYLVNVARGGVCDEPALIEALAEKRIAGAGLDVFQVEPLPADSPLWRLDNVIVTPHEGGQCDVYNDLVLEVLEKNLKCFLEGRASDMVNPVPH
jgi:D-2-hydroxyacid dehydrogenase (NADP+)